MEERNSAGTLAHSSLADLPNNQTSSTPLPPVPTHPYSQHIRESLHHQHDSNNADLRAISNDTGCGSADSPTALMLLQPPRTASQSSAALRGAHDHALSSHRLSITPSSTSDSTSSAPLLLALKSPPLPPSHPRSHLGENSAVCDESSLVAPCVKEPGSNTHPPSAPSPLSTNLSTHTFSSGAPTSSSTTATNATTPTTPANSPTASSITLSPTSFPRSSSSVSSVSSSASSSSPAPFPASTAIAITSSSSPSLNSPVLISPSSPSYIPSRLTSGSSPSPLSHTYTLSDPALGSKRGASTLHFTDVDHPHRTSHQPFSSASPALSSEWSSSHFPVSHHPGSSVSASASSSNITPTHGADMARTSPSLSPASASRMQPSSATMHSSSTPTSTLSSAPTPPLLVAQQIQMLLAQMHICVEDAKIQEESCAALRAMAAEGDWHRAIICEYGGVPLLIACLHTASGWRASAAATAATVVAKALGALVELCRPFVPQSKESVCSAGGIEAIVGSMQQFRQHPETTTHACQLLASLSLLPSLSPKLAVAKAGGIEALVAARRAHSSNTRVQLGVCKALANLSENAELRERVGKSGGVEAVLAAMLSHATHVDVQHSGCTMLMHMAAGPPHIMGVVARAGGLEAVLGAMRKHTSEEKVQSAACGVIMQLSSLAELQQMTANITEVIECVSVAMRTFLSCSQLQHFGCGALAHLACREDGQPQLLRAGAVERVVMAMKAHPHALQVQLVGLVALGNLKSQRRPSDFTSTPSISARAENRTIAIQNGAIPLVLGAMRSFPNAAHLQYYGCSALAGMAAGSADVQTQIAAAGAVDVFQAALTQHSLVGELMQTNAGVQTLFNAIVHPSRVRVKDVGEHCDDADGIFGIGETGGDGDGSDRGSAGAVASAGACEAESTDASSANSVRASPVFGRDVRTNAGVGKTSPVSAALSHTLFPRHGSFGSKDERSRTSSFSRARSGSHYEKKTERLRSASVRTAVFDGKTSNLSPAPAKQLPMDLSSPFLTMPSSADADELSARLTVMGREVKWLEIAWRMSFWLREYLQDSSEHQLLAAKMGALSTIVEAMRAHVAHTEIQVLGCEVLALLCVPLVNKSKVVVIGGADAVVAAMQAHVKDKQIQLHGCRALLNMVCDQETALLVARAKGVQAILAAMRTHTSSHPMQRHGIWALAGLAWSCTSKIKRHMLHQGTLGAVRAALECFPEDERLKAKSEGLLTILEAHARHMEESRSKGGRE